MQFVPGLSILVCYGWPYLFELWIDCTHWKWFSSFLDDKAFNHMCEHMGLHNGLRWFVFTISWLTFSSGGHGGCAWGLHRACMEKHQSVI